MIKDNLLKLDIYYKELNFENIEEMPAYSVKHRANYIQCDPRSKPLVS